MLAHLILPIVLLVSSFAHAQTTDLPLTAGHAEISGSASWSNLGGSSYTALSLQPGAEYFVMNNLSLGGSLSLTFAKYGSYSDDSSTFKFRELDVLPSGKFYFWQDAGMAAFVAQQLGWAFYQSGSDFTASTGLGISFFLNSKVAITPVLQANYGQDQTGSLNLLGRISVFL